MLHPKKHRLKLKEEKKRHHMQKNWMAMIIWGTIDFSMKNKQGIGYIDKQINSSGRLAIINASNDRAPKSMRPTLTG